MYKIICNILLCLLSVPGNIHSGVSGNDSIVATGVFSARELLRVTRSKFTSMYAYTHLFFAFNTHLYVLFDRNNLYINECLIYIFFLYVHGIKF